LITIFNALLTNRKTEHLYSLQKLLITFVMEKTIQGQKVKDQDHKGTESCVK